MANEKRRRDRNVSDELPATTTTNALRRSEPSGLWASAGYFVMSIIFGYPALMGRFLVSQRSDQFIGGYPIREFAAVWEKSGHGVPLWNPYIFGGMPFVASMNGDMFYPTALLRLLLAPDAGMTWGFIAHVFLAGCFTFLFLRRALRLGFYASFIGGLAYMAGGNVAGLVSPGHDGKLFVAALLPLTLYLLHRWIREGLWWAWGCLALTVMLALLSPHPQLFQYFLLAAGAYALFVACARAGSDTKLPVRVAIQRLGLALGAVVLGTLGGAIQYLPLLEYTPWSPRAGGKGWDHAVSYSLPPEELLNTYLPQFSGILEKYTGRNVIHFHSEYIGAAVLVLASLAFGTRVVARSIVRFWSFALIVAILWALGGFTPFYHLVYALVPGTAYFRAPSTMLFFVSFCTAVLAAIGTERVLAADIGLRRLIGWAVFAAVICVLAASGTLTHLAEGFAYPPLAGGVVANQSAMLGGAIRALLVVGAVLAIVLATRQGRIGIHRTAVLLAGVVALDLWSIVRLYWVFSAPATSLYASDPVIEYLKHLTQPGRVVPLATQALTSETRDPYFGGGDGKGDGLMVHRIRSVVGYHGNELGRYDLITGWEQDEERWPRQLGNSNLWQLLNIQYLYTNSPESPIRGARLVAGPSPNVAGNISYLYRLPGDNPSAWVVPLAVKVGDEIARQTVLDPRFDVRRVGLIDSTAQLPTQPIPQTLPPVVQTSAHVDVWEPGHIALTLSQPALANELLVVSENYYPGWSASVDGKPAMVARTDYVLIGVSLPAGGQKIELSFSSSAYQRGRFISGSVLAIIALSLLVPFVVSKRSRWQSWAAPMKEHAP